MFHCLSKTMVEVQLRRKWEQEFGNSEDRSPRRFTFGEQIERYSDQIVWWIKKSPVMTDIVNISQDDLQKSYMCSNSIKYLKDRFCSIQLLEQGPSLEERLDMLNERVYQKFSTRKNGTLRFCNGCYATGQMLRCSRCIKVYYCSERCQKNDWKEHKRTCVKT